MGDLIKFDPKKPEPEKQYCFECGCGCQDFWLMFGGTVECKDCGWTQIKAVWILLPPEILKPE
jgi:hypothetical protein